MYPSKQRKSTLAAQKLRRVVNDKSVLNHECQGRITRPFRNPCDPERSARPQDSGSYIISRTSCAHRQLLAMRAAHANASSRVGTSIAENPPTTAFVSGKGPCELVPSVATMVACCRRTPPPKIQTPAALASRTTACAASSTAGSSPSGMWSIDPLSNEIRYRGISKLPLLGRPATGLL